MADAPKRITVDEAQVEVAQTMATRYAELAGMSAADMSEAIAGIQADVIEATKDLVTSRDMAVKSHDTQLEEQSKVLKGSITEGANTLFTAAVKKSLVAAATADPRINRVTIVLELSRNEVDGKTRITTGEPVVTLFNKVPSRKGGQSTSKNGGRGEPIKVNGKEYTSAKAAYEGFFPEAKSQMNRASVVAALEKAGHSVS